MRYFYVGDTVICSIETKKGGVLTSPDSAQITIYYPDGTEAQGLTGMGEDSAGRWHYDFQTVGKVKGIYKAVVKLTDAARITQEAGAFKVR